MSPHTHCEAVFESELGAHLLCPPGPELCRLLHALDFQFNQHLQQ